MTPRYQKATALMDLVAPDKGADQHAFHEISMASLDMAAIPTLYIMENYDMILGRMQEAKKFLGHANKYIGLVDFRREEVLMMKESLNKAVSVYNQLTDALNEDPALRERLGKLENLNLD